MKRTGISIFRSFQAKLTLALVLSMLFVGAVNNFLIYRFTLDSQFNELRDKLKTIAQTAALAIDSQVFSQIPLDYEGIEARPYKITTEKLKRIKEANPSIKYIYIMARTDKQGILQFVADPTIPTKEDIEKGLTSYPGDKYDARNFPQMLQAFKGPSADKKLGIDEWGVSLSGYAPILDKEGKAIAILGVDMMADNIHMLQKEVNRRAILILVLGLIISLLLGLLISRRISNPIKKLVEGTRHIAGGDLQYRVEIKGADEISKLARDFNQMAGSLYESRKKLLNYFYRVVQAFVRALEAKDRYTRGHSDRVAEYAQKIALKMGLPEEKIELLKETALLHDIGKIGIKESILNKKEKLTDEEWETIRKHPVIGGDILKPVALSEEMLEVVKGHHERYDGKGYPDKISGQDINILTAIVSVADAYDAMTSSRAYRPAMGKEKAIEQLRKNSSIQFNPKVVDAFLQILQEGSNEQKNR